MSTFCEASNPAETGSGSPKARQRLLLCRPSHRLSLAWRLVKEAAEAKGFMGKQQPSQAAVTLVPTKIRRFRFMPVNLNPEMRSPSEARVAQLDFEI